MEALTTLKRKVIRFAVNMTPALFTAWLGYNYMTNLPSERDLDKWALAYVAHTEARGEGKLGEEAVMLVARLRAYYGKKGVLRYYPPAAHKVVFQKNAAGRSYFDGMQKINPVNLSTQDKFLCLLGVKDCKIKFPKTINKNTIKLAGDVASLKGRALLKRVEEVLKSKCAMYYLNPNVAPISRMREKQRWMWRTRVAVVRIRRHEFYIDPYEYKKIIKKFGENFCHSWSKTLSYRDEYNPVKAALELRYFYRYKRGRFFANRKYLKSAANEKLLRKSARLAFKKYVFKKLSFSRVRALPGITKFYRYGKLGKESVRMPSIRYERMFNEINARFARSLRRAGIASGWSIRPTISKLLLNKRSSYIVVRYNSNIFDLILNKGGKRLFYAISSKRSRFLERKIAAASKRILTDVLYKMQKEGKILLKIRGGQYDVMIGNISKKRVSKK